MANSVINCNIKTLEETLTANAYGTIYPTIPTDRILQIRAVDSTGNFIILPIYRAEMKVYKVPDLTPYAGGIKVRYTYF